MARGGDASVLDGEDGRGYEGWRVALASGAGVFVGFSSLLVYTFGVFLKPLSAELAWSREQVSAAFAIAACCLAVSSPLLGHLLDRTSPRAVIAPCVAVFGCGFASLALLTPRLWHLYAVFLVLGVVGNGTAQMGYSRAVSSWFDRRRGQALAILMSGSALGAVVLPPLAQAMVRALGWRTAFAVLGALVLVIGLPVVLGLVRERPPAATVSREGVPGMSVRAALGTRGFWILVTVLFFSSIAQNGVITHIAALLTDRRVSASGGALALSAMGAASLAGRLLSGLLLDRFFAGRVSCGLLGAAAVGTFLLSGADSLAAGVVAAALIGFGMGGEADVAPYLLSRYYGLRRFSTLYGLTWTFYAFAGALGPVLMGKAFDASGSYERLLVQLAVGILAMAVLSLFLPRDASVALPAVPIDVRPKAVAAGS